ncbi:MAG: two-component regulator propeller domain-containing protein [Bryobacteraceae bacterium]
MPNSGDKIYSPHLALPTWITAAKSASVIFLASALVLPCIALDANKTLTQYAHRVWGQEEGLFQPTIYSILQTRDGFLWLGTQDSLIRFDGMRFREFDGAGGAFHRSLIRALAEDREGNFWIGSVGNGVAKMSTGGAATRYTTKNGLPSDSVFCIDSKSADGVWICTNQGLAELAQGHFRVFTTRDGLPSNQIRSTCETADGTRWVAGLDFGLARWNGLRFEAYSENGIAPKENVTVLECGRDGSLWAGTPSGLIELREGRMRRLTTRDGLPDNAVSAIEEGPDGSLWIGTNDGVSRYRNGEISVYRTRDGLSHSLVLSLYIDREGSLWAGTKDGLDQFTDGKVTPYTTNEGMLSNDVGPVLEDAAGHLWAGTLDRGLNSFDGRRFRAVTTRNGLLSDTILSLQLDKAGDLWVGTSRGLNRLRNGAVIASYTRKDGLSGAEVRALSEDVQGTLWAGTDKGLDRFTGTKFERHSESDGIVALAGGHTIRLFVSTDAPALYSMRDKFVESSSPGAARPVDCYFLDHVRHSAWMGTLGSGLLRWQNGAFTHVHVKDGLYDNRIYSIVRDDNSNFWMASSKGIFRVSQKELDDFADGKTRFVTSVPFSTGQLRFECQSGVQPAACRTHDGRLWFSTTNGLVVVDPNHLLKNDIPPPAQITAIFINGRRVDPQQDIDLRPSEKNLEIRYAGLSFISPEKVSFRYILRGYDKTWTDAGVRREAFFTNLPPRQFRFEVMARNADGIWSKQPASFYFTITPEFYQRVWFFPLLAVTIGIAIAAGYRMRIRRLQHRFDLVLGERSRIARELHDTLLQGLSGITMQLQALWKRLPASKEKQFLEEIIKDAGTCSREARQSVWGLRTDSTGALSFSEKIAMLARQATTEQRISLSLELQPISLSGQPEAEYELLRIIQEVVSNTVKHARARKLEIRAAVENGQLEITLADDGVGFSTGLDQARYGHFGLLGIRERAREIGAELTVRSAPEMGTTVLIRFALASPGMSGSNAEPRFEHQTS